MSSTYPHLHTLAAAAEVDALIALAASSLVLAPVPGARIELRENHSARSAGLKTSRRSEARNH